MSSEPDDEEGYDHVADFDMSESESENDNEDLRSSTPLTAPQTPRTLRPSELKTISCPYENCGKTFNRKARLAEHLRSHTNTRPFKCPHSPCDKDFLRESHLTRHVKSAHSKVRDYTCSFKGCGKSFATGTRMRRHEASHEGHEKYRCHGYEGCDLSFRKHDTLKRHITLVHEQTLPFSCPSTEFATGEPCTKSFETAEKLRAHQRSKHDVTKFACTECLRAEAVEEEEYPHDNGSPKIKEEESKQTRERRQAYFPTYADLKAHLAVVHPPTCEYCPTSFKTAKELTRHLELVHSISDTTSASTKTAFACHFPKCSRTFKKKGNLSVHIKTVHEKRRDFVCGQTEVSLPEITANTEVVGCGRDFTSKGTLEEHIRTGHLGMAAKRVERNRKRKAEKESAEDEGEGSAKKRKPRKDKGVKKGSALASLVASRTQRPTFDDLDSEESDVEFALNDDDDDEELDDDSEALSGSVTMFGSQLYHHDSGRNSVSLDNADSPAGFLGCDESDYPGLTFDQSTMPEFDGLDLSDMPPDRNPNLATNRDSSFYYPANSAQDGHVPANVDTEMPLDPLLFTIESQVGFH